MRQGTTPTHSFTLPFDADYPDEIEITYSQNGAIVLKKYKKDCLLSGNKISFKLTQEETFKFSYKDNVEIQIRALLGGSCVIGCDPMVVSVKKCNSREVITV